MAVKEGALIPHSDDDTISNAENSSTTDDDIGLYDSNDIHASCSTSTSASSTNLNADQDEYQYQDTMSSSDPATLNEQSLPLSRAAIYFLHHASRIAHTAAKRRRRVEISSADDPTCQRLNAAVYEQLVALRQKIPTFKQRAATSSCVVAEILEYIHSVRKNVHDLEQLVDLSTINAAQIKSNTTDRSTNDVEMQLETLDDGDIKIHVSCQRRPGLMGDVVMGLESLGLALDFMNVSSTTSRFTLQAVVTLTDEICSKQMIGEEAMRNAILKAICN